MLNSKEARLVVSNVWADYGGLYDEGEFREAMVKVLVDLAEKMPKDTETTRTLLAMSVVLA